jgi:hypothetical protein
MYWSGSRVGSGFWQLTISLKGVIVKLLIQKYDIGRVAHSYPSLVISPSLVQLITLSGSRAKSQ